MKVLQILKYIVIFILTTFLLFWGNLYVNKGHGSSPSFGEALLYYVWGVLIIVATIFKELKKIFGFSKNLSENSFK
tara:strand:- start:485 stop:712 length:228 start_codon:yes stop_codon:yes gene_type:complete